MRKRATLRSLLTNPSALVGSILFVTFVTVAIFAPQIATHEPTQQNLLGRLAPPAWSGGTPEHLLGTDQLGRDMFSRLVYGTRIALIVGFGGVLLATVIGTVVGIVSGFMGGWFDTIAMRVTDAIVAIPNLILYLTVLGVFSPSVLLLVGVIGAVNWTTVARVVRAEVMSVREREFVEASHAIGRRRRGILPIHILPNVASSILVMAVLNIAGVIVMEAGLSYLGFGVQAPTVTWGRMLSDGRSYIATAWWLATFPGLCITLLTLSFLLLGDWLRDTLDPRIR